MVKINGQDCDKAGISVAEYLAAENYNVNHIVVEYNLTIIPKAVSYTHLTLPTT